MLKRFKSFSNTPYVYDSNNNEIYKVDENVFKALSEAGDIVANCKDEVLKKNMMEAGMNNDILPVQTPDQLKAELEDLKIGFKKLILGITHSCNLRCKYCIYSGNYKDERTHEQKQMSIETADKIIDAYFVKRKTDHPSFVIFYGGEPLVNFEAISHIVTRLASMGEKVAYSVTTNGMMLKNESILDFLIKHGFIMNISFDGPVQEIMRVDEAGRGTFNDLMTIIEHISKKHPKFYKERVGFNVTVTPATNLPETVEFFNTHPLFKEKVLNIIRQYDPDNAFCKRYNLMEKKETLKKEFEILRRHYPDIYKEKLPFYDSCYLALLANLQQRPMGKKEYLPMNSCCYPGLNAIFVDIDGTTSACERTEHCPIGNINSEPVNDKAVSELVNKYHEIASKLCPKCWAASLCSKCYSHVKRGEINEENFVSVCDDFRSSLLKSLELFTTIKEKDEHAFEDIKSVTDIPATTDYNENIVI